MPQQHNSYNHQQHNITATTAIVIMAQGPLQRVCAHFAQLRAHRDRRARRVARRHRAALLRARQLPAGEIEIEIEIRLS